MTANAIFTQDWTELAACKGVDIRVFFPRAGGTSYAVARSYCDRCPVRRRCLEDGLEFEATFTRGRSNNRHGMVGGTTPDERAGVAWLWGLRTNRRSDILGEAKNDPRDGQTSGGRDRELYGSPR